MNTYKINCNQLRQQPEISDMLTALERGLAKFKVDFYLVGVVAREVWLNAINKIEPRRTTGDFDFAVFINNIGIYEELREHLINIKDISDILNHFFEMYDEEIWTNHADLFEGVEIDLKHLATSVTGREIKKIAKRNPKLYKSVERLVAFGG